MKQILTTITKNGSEPGQGTISADIAKAVLQLFTNYADENPISPEYSFEERRNHVLDQIACVVIREGKYKSIPIREVKTTDDVNAINMPRAILRAAYLWNSDGICKAVTTHTQMRDYVVTKRFPVIHKSPADNPLQSISYLSTHIAKQPEKIILAAKEFNAEKSQNRVQIQITQLLTAILAALTLSLLFFGKAKDKPDSHKKPGPTPAPASAPAQLTGEEKNPFEHLYNSEVSRTASQLRTEEPEISPANLHALAEKDLEAAVVIVRDDGLFSQDSLPEVEAIAQGPELSETQTR